MSIPYDQIDLRDLNSLEKSAATLLSVLEGVAQELDTDLPDWHEALSQEHTQMLSELMERRLSGARWP